MNKSISNDEAHKYHESMKSRLMEAWEADLLPLAMARILLSYKHFMKPFTSLIAWTCLACWAVNCGPTRVFGVGVGDTEEAFIAEFGFP